MTALKLLVFDWDGTLYDSVDRIVASLLDAARAAGLKAPNSEAAKNVIGLGLQESMMALFPHESEALQREVAEQYKRIFTERCDVPMRLFPNVREMLTRLHERGYRLAVATGKSRRGLDRVLEQENLRDLFHATRCADETTSKPHPYMLIELMTVLNATPNETAMIGDSHHDMEMAVRAQAHRVAVTYGVQTRRNMIPYQPLAILDDVEQLSLWLEQLVDAS